MSLLSRVREEADYMQVVWMTTPPIATEIRGGFLIEQLQFQQNSMRFNIMEGNTYAATVAAAFGFDVLGGWVGEQGGGREGAGMEAGPGRGRGGVARFWSDSLGNSAFCVPGNKYNSRMAGLSKQNSNMPRVIIRARALKCAIWQLL